VRDFAECLRFERARIRAHATADRQALASLLERSLREPCTMLLLTPRMRTADLFRGKEVVTSTTLEATAFDEAQERIAALLTK
jgi:hypothetical protein